MFDGFEPFRIKTSAEPEVTIAGIRSTGGKDLPPLLLLHGFPQTHHMWHRVAPQLTGSYNVVLMDLRGYGASSKPRDDVSSYAKSAMALDCVAVMDGLGFGGAPFYVCAHDRGARVAHKLCVDHPDRVRKAIFLDICPTLAMYEATNLDFAKAYFHWFFLIQKSPLPETLILGSPRKLAEMFMGGRQRDGPAIFASECFEVATLDMDEQKRDLAEGRRIKSPLRVLWGNVGIVEKAFDALAEWRKVTETGVGVDGHSVDSGHYIPEQAPDVVVAEMRDFLV
ncbi:hypothetical protein KVR01_009497 [Diaporthe batatas]|uniref:uncharacterized protein n=1 Tax=Diaporthe batatas TaxID=748121 RepID=UPI001D055798|nr:uncharacterized protein KVR01_009497 [Diaporthe batatas]KAG8161233.1 hypothetical protein KVR01_009497 [Diaporthe batatas]